MLMQSGVEHDDNTNGSGARPTGAGGRAGGRGGGRAAQVQAAAESLVALSGGDAAAAAGEPVRGRPVRQRRTRADAGMYADGDDINMGEPEDRERDAQVRGVSAAEAAAAAAAAAAVRGGDVGLAAAAAEGTAPQRKRGCAIRKQFTISRPT